ncbi:MAG: DNA replication and repair protein RecF [Patescibacteria group bacterium]|nr:DNA replication and repair protein RecF [Patescibacteria group bacterium]
MITDLRLQNFRSYEDASFEFGPGVNIVVGPNASGKTNLLEALLVLARGGSYRVSDQDLISFDAPWARLDAHNSEGGLRTIKLVTEPKPTKTYEINERQYKRLSLQTSLPVVLFEPNDLQLLSGGPERRRNYLDDLLEQTTPGYGAIRRQYKRALAQRNALLKQHGASDSQLFPWNVRLSQLAGQIVKARCLLLNRIAEELSELYIALSKTATKVTVSYSTPLSVATYETSLLKKLEASIELDRLRGFTASGPHREDMELLFEGHSTSASASRGETRTAVLALKIIELRVLEAARGVTPLLLLDDVFSELDGKRRHALTDYLAAYQTFITTTDADVVVQHFAENCTVIALSGD